MRKIAFIAAALGLVSAPLAAESLTRTAAPPQGEDSLGGGPGAILGAIGLAAVVATVLPALFADFSAVAALDCAFFAAG